MKRYQSLVESWAADLITQIDKELSEKVLKPDSPAALATANGTVHHEKVIKLARQIFTLGELAQICPKLIGRKLYLIMQNIVFLKVSIFVLQVGSSIRVWSIRASTGFLKKIRVYQYPILKNLRVGIRVSSTGFHSNWNHVVRFVDIIPVTVAENV